MDETSLPEAPRIDAHMHIFAPGQRDLREEIAARNATFAELYAHPKAKLASAADLDVTMAPARLDAPTFHANRASPRRVQPSRAKKEKDPSDMRSQRPRRREKSE